MKRVIGFSLPFLLLACSAKQETIRPIVQDITESVYASGVVRSRNQYEVFAPVSGIIDDVHVVEGSIVHRGDPLFTLSHENARNQTENARIAAAFQFLPANEDRLREGEEAVRIAAEKLAQDSLLYVRQQRLWGEDIGTRNELDQRALNYQNSLAALRSSRLRLRQLRHQLVFADRQAQQQVRIQESIAGDYVIRARRDGRVYRIDRKIGELVAPQAAIALLGSSSDFELELRVDENDAVKVSVGQAVLVTMDCFKGRVFGATIREVFPAIDPATRSVTVIATFDRPPASLLPNLTAEANIVLRSKSRALTIPRSYLNEDQTVLLRSGKRKLVQTGARDLQRVEVTEGLNADDVLLKPAQ
ncbi:MAG: HlyD family efflux transporter periplasmic adaptor subunit [Chitinophagaceae bacterium]|nr:MAG: HlyD family efflux transporter periplasmic adaptor subunit [Chitinophagaceae bacterium]